MSSLNLTNRQMCEKFAEQMARNYDKAYGWLTFLSSIAVDEDGLSVTPDDLVNLGIINDNLATQAITILSPIRYSDGGGTGKSYAITIRFENKQYDGTAKYTHIYDVLCANKGMLIDVTGEPVTDYLASTGFNNLNDYARSLYKYNDGVLVGEVVAYLGTERIHLANLEINDNLSRVTFDSNVEAIMEVIQPLTIVSAGSQMIREVSTAIAQGLHAPSDLFAIVSTYLSSSCAEVAAFAKRIISAGRNAINETISILIRMFRSSFNDVHEDSDGSLTWNITSNKVVTNIWQVAGNILIGSGQILSSVLLFSGTAIGKVVGAALFIGTSIAQAITTTVGTVSGTTPYICDEAIDHAYHDPFAQGYGTSLNIDWGIIDDSVMRMLKENGRAKIVTPSHIIYIYNYDEKNFTVDWKCFTNLDYALPVLPMEQVSDWTPSLPMFVQGNRKWYQGFVSLYIHEITGTEFQWAFSPNFNGGRKDSILSSGVHLVGTNYLKTYADWLQMIYDKAGLIPSVSLSARSPDAADWVKLWETLRTNTIVALSTVFCNPKYSLNGTMAPCRDTPGPYGMLDKLFGYRMYGSAPGYRELVNAMVDLANVDHSNDNFLLSMLQSLGLAVCNQTNPTKTYSKFIRFEINDDLNLVKVEDKTLANMLDANVPFNGDQVGVFPFIAVDQYAYVTPPSCDYKSIIFGAIMSAAVVAAVSIGITVGANIIRNKVRVKMQIKGADLLSEGEVFRKAFTVDQWKQLPSEDRKTYTKAYNKYIAKVNIFNKISSCLGLGTLDWVNNWWNGASAGPIALPNAGVTTDVNAETVQAAANTVDSFTDLYCAVSEPASVSGKKLTDGQVLYSLITGITPDKSNS